MVQDALMSHVLGERATLELEGEGATPKVAAGLVDDLILYCKLLVCVYAEVGTLTFSKDSLQADLSIGWEVLSGNCITTATEVCCDCSEPAVWPCSFGRIASTKRFGVAKRAPLACRILPSLSSRMTLTPMAVADRPDGCGIAWEGWGGLGAAPSGGGTQLLGVAGTLLWVLS